MLQMRVGSASRDIYDVSPLHILGSQALIVARTSLLCPRTLACICWASRGRGLRVGYHPCGGGQDGHSWEPRGSFLRRNFPFSSVATEKKPRDQQEQMGKQVSQVIQQTFAQHLLCASRKMLTHTGSGKQRGLAIPLRANEEH